MLIIRVTDKIKPPNRGGDSNAIAIFGTLPPNRQSYEDLCGPPTICDNCTIPRDSKCKETVATLYDLVANLEIKHAENRSYTFFPNRKTGKRNLILKMFVFTFKNLTKMLTVFVLEIQILRLAQFKCVFHL